MKWTGRIGRDLTWVWMALRPARKREPELPPGYDPPSGLLTPRVRASSGFIYQSRPTVPIRTYVTGTIASGDASRRATTWQCPARCMVMTSSVPLSSLICYCGRSMIELPPDPRYPQVRS